MASSGIGFIQSTLSLAGSGHAFINESADDGGFEDCAIHEPLTNDTLSKKDPKGSSPELEHPLDSSYSSLRLSMDDMSPSDCNLTPVDTSTVSLESEDSCADGFGSNSDVEFIETPNEVIELSDDDSNECAKLLQNFCVPDSIIRGLKHGSNIISLKLAESIKTRNDSKDILTEVPMQTWSLPWKVVSTLFKNPSLEIKPHRKTKLLDASINFKKSKGIRESILKKRRTPVSHVKSEKNETDENSKVNVTSVVHLNQYKHPEFLEFTRSGRLKKKPNRLRDSVNIFNLKTRQRRRSAQCSREKVNNPISSKEDTHDSVEEDSIKSDILSKNTYSPEDPSFRSISSANNPQSEKMTFYKFVLEKKIDEDKMNNEDFDFFDESNDTLLTGTSSDSEIGTLINQSSCLSSSSVGTSESIITSQSLDDNHKMHSYTPSTTVTKKQKLKKRSSSNKLPVNANPDAQSFHNARERIRREALRTLYKTLKSVIDPDNDKSINSKIGILNGAQEMIHHLNYDLYTVKVSINKLKAYNKILMSRLANKQKAKR